MEIKEEQVMEVLRKYAYPMLDSQHINSVHFTKVASDICRLQYEKGVDSDLKEKFEEFRTTYRFHAGHKGGVRGLDTEFAYFKKKHKDYRVVIPILKEAVEKEAFHKTKDKIQGKFVPEWKNFKTWVNNRCWEVEYPEVEDLKIQGLDKNLSIPSI